MESAVITGNEKRLTDYPDILDVEQMAKLLRVSKKTAYKVLNENRIAYIRIGHQYRIPKTNVLRYLRFLSDKPCDKVDYLAADRL